MHTWKMAAVFVASMAIMQGQTSSVPPAGAPSPSAPVPDAPARVSSSVMASHLLTHGRAVYPQKAKDAGVSGTVVLHAIIGKDGTIQKLEVISGPDLLQQAALDLVNQWTYTPYLRHGQPTEVDTTILVNFSLNKPKPAPSPDR